MSPSVTFAGPSETGPQALTTKFGDATAILAQLLVQSMKYRGTFGRCFSQYRILVRKEAQSCRRNFLKTFAAHAPKNLHLGCKDLPTSGWLTHSTTD